MVEKQVAGKIKNRITSSTSRFVCAGSKSILIGCIFRKGWKESECEKHYGAYESCHRFWKFQFNSCAEGNDENEAI